MTGWLSVFKMVLRTKYCKSAILFSELYIYLLSPVPDTQNIVLSVLVQE